MSPRSAVRVRSFFAATWLPVSSTLSPALMLTVSPDIELPTLAVAKLSFIAAEADKVFLELLLWKS